MNKYVYFDDGTSVSSNRSASRKQQLDCNIVTNDFYREYDSKRIVFDKDNTYWNVIGLYRRSLGLVNINKPMYLNVLRSYGVSDAEIRRDVDSYIPGIY